MTETLLGVLDDGRDIVSHLRVAVGWCGSGGGWRVEWSGGVVEWHCFSFPIQRQKLNTFSFVVFSDRNPTGWW